MAIYHNSTKIISRSKGRSAVGASAYRSGEKIRNEYDGIQHDYSRKGGVVYSEIMLPQQAKKEFKNRVTLWNEVEKIEKSKNSQLAREVEVALPKELNREEQIKLIKSYVQDNFVKNGMCADLNIHDKGDGNPHAHIMLTMRPIKENGEWGAKSKEQKILDKSGKIQRTKTGRILSKKIETTNWNTKEFLESYRKDWADKINQKLKEKGINQIVDHRSYEEQGIEKIPTIHEGATARQIEKMGRVSDRIEINKRIKAINEKTKECNKEIQKIENEIQELKNEVTKINKSLEPQDEIQKIKNDIKEIQEYRAEISDISRKLENIKRDKEQTLLKDQQNRTEIEKLKIAIQEEQNRRNSLGFFKRTEKKNCDDRINKYSEQLEKLENQLLTDDKITGLTKEINEVQQKLDIADKQYHKYDKQAEELFKKEYKINLERKNKHREIERQQNRMRNRNRSRNYLER